MTPKTWITLDENNRLRWYRIAKFILKQDEDLTVQVMFVCTENTKDNTLTMTMRQKFPDGSKKGAYAYPTDLLMCTQKADEFLSGIGEEFEMAEDSGNVYMPDGVDAVEYMKDSVHFNTIEELTIEPVTADDLNPDA